MGAGVGAAGAGGLIVSGAKAAVDGRCGFSSKSTKLAAAIASSCSGVGCGGVGLGVALRTSDFIRLKFSSPEEEVSSSDSE